MHGKDYFNFLHEYTIQVYNLSAQYKCRSRQTSKLGKYGTRGTCLILDLIRATFQRALRFH